MLPTRNKLLGLIIKNYWVSKDHNIFRVKCNLILSSVYKLLGLITQTIVSQKSIYSNHNVMLILH